MKGLNKLAIQLKSTWTQKLKFIFDFQGECYPAGMAKP